MSFDLGVWRAAGQLITAAEATQFYSELCARPFQSFIPGQEMAGFVDSVVERFRAGHATPDLPWSAEPDVGDDCAIMPIQSSLAEYVFPIVCDLARDRRFVCFDPQASTVYQPATGNAPDNSFTLELSDGRVIAGPDLDLVLNSVRNLSGNNWFVVLERRQNFYLQAGYGDQAGAPGGRYVIEYRDGGPDKHWRAILPTPDDLPAAFAEYFQGVTGWVSRFSWSPLGIH
jgi:hypothetical protein